MVDAEEAVREAAGELESFRAMQFGAGRVQRKEMQRCVVLIALLAWIAPEAHAAQRVTVAELEQVLVQQQAAHESDEETASQLGSVELSERLSAPTLNRLKAEFKPGEKTAKQLDVMADVSALLEPPLSELPTGTSLRSRMRTASKSSSR